MFKVKGTFVGFMNDSEKYPCHFDYKPGETFTYDGEKIEGRICPGVLLTMVPTVWQTFFMGNRAYERILFKYSGLSVKDPTKKEVDGIGFRPLKETVTDNDNRSTIVSTPERPTRLKQETGFACADCRTSAYFSVETVDLASGGYTLPYYRREMSILEKVKEQPGMDASDILDSFTEAEKEDIYPPLHKVNVQLMLEELEETNYVTIKDGRAFPK